MDHDRLAHIEDAARTLQSPLDPAGADALLSKIHGTIRRRRRQKIAAGAALLALLIALPLWRLNAPDAPAPQPGELRFVDGSSATPAPGAQLAVVAQRADLIHLDLTRGQATFSVTPNPQRAFVVQAADASASVLGTRFTVERRAHTLLVRVHEGRVAVRGADEQAHTLTAAQSVEVPLHAKAALEPPRDPALAAAVQAAASSLQLAQGALPQDEPPAAPEVPAPKKVAPLGPSWQALARAGKHREAAQALKAARPLTPKDLMLAADVMRLNEDPAAAIPYLLTIERDHPRSPSAPLAIFTRARLLERLGNPADAAAAFALLTKRYPEDALAEHALAREVEAWAKAKQPDRARAAADRYLSLYPDGPRLRAVRLHGGR